MAALEQERRAHFPDRREPLWKADLPVEANGLVDGDDAENVISCLRNVCEGNMPLVMPMVLMQLEIPTGPRWCPTRFWA